MARPPRSSSTSGQASTEYVALLAVLAAVLAGAGLLVAPPALAKQVTGALRTAICMVGGDICRSADARAEGLDPCRVHERTQGSSGGLSVLVLGLGGNDETTLTRRSDGSVVVSTRREDEAGAGGGFGFTATPLGIELEYLGGSAGFRFARGRSWDLPDMAAATRLLAAMRAADPLPPPTWTYREGGEFIAGQAGFDAVTGESVRTLGRRTGPGGTTWYGAVRAEAAALEPLGIEGLSASRDFVVERTTVGGEPRTLTFRVVDAAGAGRVEEVAGRLDLRDPVNRAVADRLLRPRVPTTPSVLRDVRSVVARMLEAGTVERTVHEVEAEEHGVEVAAKLGLELGFRVGTVRRTSRLTDADVWTRADGVRRRADCVGDGA